jgi:WD40 repeat protein
MNDSYDYRQSPLRPGFVGRQRLISDITSHLRTTNRRFLTITGEPGIGKTALAQELAVRLPAHAVQYCLRRKSSSIDPIAFSKSISSQLATTLEGFEQFLVNQIAPNVTISVNQSITSSPGSRISAVHIENLALQSWSSYQAFDRLVKAPLRDWCAANLTRDVVVVVDAIDQAHNSGFSPSVLDLLISSNDTPTQLKIVVTSRVIEPLEALAAHKIQLLASDPDNLADLRSFVAQALADFNPPLRDDLLREVLEEILVKSDGNFLYAAYVLAHIVGRLAEGQEPKVTELPSGLDAFYRDFLEELTRRRSQQSWRTEYRPVIGLLSVAHDSLSMEDLAAFCETDKQALSDILSDVAEVLDPEARRKGSYRLYHDSFHDFISNRELSGSFWIDLRSVESSLCRLIQIKWARAWKECPLYGIQHLTDHLAAIDENQLLNVLFDYDWLFQALTRTSFEVVMRAYSHLASVPEVRSLQVALRLSAHILIKEPERLPEQLLGRLQGDSPRMADFLGGVRQKHRLSWLRPIKSTLPGVGSLEYRTLISEYGSLTALAFGEMETCLISGSTEGFVIVWDLQLSQPRFVLRVSVSPITCIASESDRLLVAGHANGIIAAWDIRFGTEVARCEALKDGIVAASIVGDTHIVFADHTGSIFDLDVRPNSPVPRQLISSSERHSRLVLSRDGSTAAYLTKSLDVWSVTKCEKIYHSDEPSDGLWNHDAALTPDGKIAITTFHDGLLLHDTTYPNPSTRGDKIYISHYWVNRMCVGSSGKRLYWIGWRGSDFGGNIGSPALEGYELPHLKRVLSEIGSPSQTSALAVSKNDAFLAYSFGDRIKVLDIASGKDKDGENSIAINRITISPDGTLAACTINRNGALLYDMDTGSNLGQISPDQTMYYRGPGGGTYAAAFSANGRKLIVASYSATFCVLDVKGHEGSRSVRGIKKAIDEGGREFNGIGGRASCIVFLEGDSKFACSNEDGQILVWRSSRAKPTRIIDAHRGQITKLIMNCGHLVSCSLDGLVRVWDWRAGKLLAQYESPQGAIHDIALASDTNAYLALEEPVLPRVDLYRGKTVDQVSLPTRGDGFVSADRPWLWWRTRVAVTPLGNVIATTLDNQIAFLTGRSSQPTMCNRHRGVIRDLALDKSGELAATCSSEGLVSVWETRTAVLVASFQAESDVRSCALTPDGTRVICGEITGRVHVLELKRA